MSDVSKRIVLIIVVIGLVVLSGVLIYQQQKATLIERHEVPGNPISGLQERGTNNTIVDDHSIEAHKALLEKDPQDAHALVALGQTYFQQQDWYNALRYLSRASLVLPNDPNIQYMLGFTQAQRGDYTQAEENFKLFIKNTNAPIGYMSLGILYVDFLNKPQEAKEAFEAVLSSKDTPQDMKDAAQKQLDKLNK